MNEVGTFAEIIRRALPTVKKGSLRIWGEWFGKPYDNWHTLTGCDAEGEALRLYFDDDEKLIVWSPKGLIADMSTFRIAQADRVRLEWFYYGRPKVSSNLYFEDFVKSGQRICVTTNVDWYEPKFMPKATEPAVEIL
jgi:hypothetical protein